MPTRPAISEPEGVRALRARVARPSIIEIEGATSYWLEDASGAKVSPVSATSARPLAQVLADVRNGISPANRLLVCRLADGMRHVVGGGDALADAALGADASGAESA